MKSHVNRRAVDLSAYPDLVVIYLGMRVNTFTGIKTVLGLGPQISKAVADKPDGLLLHESVLYSLRHIGMRQYWRDFESMEAWARTLPHSKWWKVFLRDSGGTGFWHETYYMRGGMEAIYDDMAIPTGMMHFASLQPARGGLFSARQRLRLHGEAKLASPFAEDELVEADKS
jgi:Domain of unknown function (DUF4188)